MAVNKDEIDTLIDMEKLRNEIKRDLAREHNWEAQEKHWLAQQKYWHWAFILGALAVLVNGFKSLWS